MESITVYPKNEKQKSLLKSLLEELKIRFEVSEKTHLSQQEFYTKIDKAIEDAEMGKTFPLTKEKQRELLGL